MYMYKYAYMEIPGIYFANLIKIRSFDPLLIDHYFLVV